MSKPGLDLADLRSAVVAGRIEWHRHALERMLERDIPRKDVLDVLLSGERIEEYPNDFPLSSALFLGWAEERPLHAVVAFEPSKKTVGIITVYEPSLERFENGFKTRRRDNG